MVYSHQTNAGKGILRMEGEIRGLFCPCFTPVNPLWQLHVFLLHRTWSLVLKGAVCTSFAKKCSGFHSRLLELPEGLTDKGAYHFCACA